MSVWPSPLPEYCNKELIQLLLTFVLIPHPVLGSATAITLLCSKLLLVRLYGPHSLRFCIFFHSSLAKPVLIQCILGNCFWGLLWRIVEHVAPT